MPRRNFATAAEVMHAAGQITFVTLRVWIKRGILPKPIEAGPGRGNLAKYAPSAVARADLARRLRAQGWSLNAIAEHMASLFPEPPETAPEPPDDEAP